MLDVLVIGGGAAGTLSALSLSAASKSVGVVRDRYGALALSPGIVDLPPSNRFPAEDFKGAIDLWSSALKEEGLELIGNGEERLTLMTEVGGVRSTGYALQSLAEGDIQKMGGERVVLIDVEGLNSFPVERMRRALLETVERQGDPPSIDVEVRTVRFREWSSQGGIPIEVMARELDRFELGLKLAQKVRDLLRRERFDRVGFPAILGVEHHRDLYRLIRETVEFPCFEWLPLSTAPIGLRWQRGIDRVLERRGVRMIAARAVQSISHQKRLKGLFVETSSGRSVVEARSVILATGKFFGGGIPGGPPWREPIFGIPVYGGGEPLGERSLYSQLNLFSIEPQPIFRCGLRVDSQMRPLDEQGDPIYENLYAAGSLLEGHDDTSHGLGSVLASAYTASKNVIEELS